MKLKLILSSIIFSSLFSFTTLAQNPDQRRTCGTAAPGPEWDAWFNQKVKEYKAAKGRPDVNPVTITIPVVVHVIHGGQGIGTFPNLSVAQIKSQINVFNADFAGIGYKSSALAATGFSAVGAASTNINFCLAQFDPDGNAMVEPGIHRVNFNSQAWQNPNVPGTAALFQSYMDGTIKPQTIWDPSQYFNIWVSDVNASAYLLGYATFPAGSGLTGLSSNFGNLATDGIWIWAKAFGSTGTLDPTYNRGRTAVHETGHWLGLRHIGGDASNPAGDCNATDYCADTPAQKGGFGSGSNGQNFGSPTYPLHVNVCSSPYGDMFMNFMDYTDDGVLSMFTPNQNDRMQAALAFGTYRKDLNASSATQCVGMPSIVFADIQEGCVLGGSKLDFQNDTSISTSYTWAATPSSGVIFSPSANSSNPIIKYPSAGIYTITVVSTNAIGLSTSTIEVTANTCLGISKKGQSRDLLMWPNPAGNEVMIRLPENLKSTNMQVQIFGALGNLILKQNIESFTGNNLSVNTSSLSEGVFLLVLTYEGKSETERLLIKR